MHTGNLLTAYLREMGVAQVTKTFTDREAGMRWLAAPWTEAERRAISGPDADTA